MAAGGTDEHARIAQRAKEIWEAEGRPEGRAAEHWARAEKEIAEAALTSELDPKTTTGASGKPAARPRARKATAPAESAPAKPSPPRRTAKTAVLDAPPPEAAAAKPRSRKAASAPTEAAPTPAAKARKKAEP